MALLDDPADACKQPGVRVVDVPARKSVSVPWSDLSISLSLSLTLTLSLSQCQGTGECPCPRVPPHVPAIWLAGGEEQTPAPTDATF